MVDLILVSPTFDVGDFFYGVIILFLVNRLMVILIVS